MTAISSPRVIAAMRTVMGIAEQMPKLSCEFFDQGPGSKIQRLADYLRHETERGKLDIDDPLLAAMQFLELCQTSIVRPLLFGHVMTEEERLARVEKVVGSALDVFLRAYQAPRG